VVGTNNSFDITLQGSGSVLGAGQVSFKGDLNSNGQFDFQGQAGITLNPIHLASATFDIGNENPFHLPGITTGAMAFTFSAAWDFVVFHGSLSGAVVGTSGGFDISLQASGSLLNTVKFGLKGDLNSNGSFDLQGSTGVTIGPVNLGTAQFDFGNENPFHINTIPQGALALSLSGSWTFGTFANASVTVTIAAGSQGFDATVDAKGKLLGNTIDLHGDVTSGGQYDLHASDALNLFGVSLTTVSVDVKSTQGFSLTATWDVPLVFHGQVTGSIGLDGHVQLSAQAQVLKIGGFGLSMDASIDLNPAIGYFNVHVGATQDVLVATVGFSADSTWHTGGSLQLSLSGHAALTGILADIIEGSVEFDLQPNRVHFHGDVHIPKVPQAGFSIDATVDASGALTGIPGINGLGAIFRDLKKLGGQAAALWHHFISDAGQVAQGLAKDIGLGGQDLVNALSTVVPDPAQLSNALQNGLNWSKQEISGIFGSIGGSLGDSVKQKYTAAKKWLSKLGYTEGGIVFIDSNFNGILDPGESQGFTDGQGGFVLYIPTDLDPNDTGVLADSEAQIVEQGGTDLVTGQPEVAEGIAPGSWSVISSLTTQVALLYDNYGFTVGQAESQVLLATGLPAQVDLSTFDSIGATLRNDANGPAVLGTESILENTIAMVSALTGGTPGSAQANAVQGALAGLIAQATGPLDFGNAATITALIQSVETSTGQTLDPNLVAGASTVIADVNQEIEGIPQTADLAFIRKVAQVSIVAQTQVAGDLAKAAAGQTSIDTVLANDTGAALESAIAATPTPPTVVTPMNLVVAATSAAGATVDFTTQAFDIAGETLTPTTSIASGSVFPIGVTTVSATATDSLGDTVTTTFTVTVADSTPPTLTVPASFTVEANTTGGATVTLPQATATDPVDPNPTVTEDQSSGFFPLGTTTVNVTATDSAGNVSTGTFTITVVDTTPPSLTVPTNLVVEANTTGGANVVLPPAIASDSADPNPRVAEDQASGFFPLGTTTVNVTATDASGNTTTGTFTVTVTDSTPPVINVPSNLIVEANTTGGANVVLPQATATDIADPNPTVSEDHSSGFFPLGTTTVDVTATDASGNSSTGAFTVTVMDTTAPTLTLPANLIVQANTTGGANVTLPTVTATDVADPNPTVTEDRSSGLFPLGTTAVDVTATDASGNVTTSVFTVTVVNTTPPTLTVPKNVVVEANTLGGAFVTLPAATATDVADPNPLVTYDHFSGFYPIGTTTIGVTATDSSGNTSTGDFTVTVLSDTPPTLTLPNNVVVEAAGPGGAQITLPQATATDIADPQPVITYDHQSGLFPLGLTTINVTATDAFGNVSTGSFTVDVVDTTPPTLTVPLTMVVAANVPGGALVTLPQATATDLVDPSSVITYDHQSGFFPVGTTFVTVTASDYSGNTSTGSFAVTVTPGGTTTTLVDNGTGSSTYGDAVRFTVSVSSNVGGTIPDGETVLLEDADNGNTPVGIGTLENGSATITVSKLNAGTHDLFVYYGGDANNAAGQSSTVTQSVAKRALLIQAVTNTKMYDGNTSAAALPVVVGLQTGDSITGLGEAYKNAAVGSNKTLVPFGTIVDGNGGQNYAPTWVNNVTGVIVPPPVAVPGGPYQTTATSALTLDASGSYAPDGTSIAVYQWTFGDGTSYQESAASAPDGRFDGRNSHIYQKAGIYFGTLTVIEPSGFKASATFQVTVIPRVTSSTATLVANTQSLTINGAGFDPYAPNDTVTFSGGATGTVTSATATQLIVTGLKGLTPGVLNVTVTVDGPSSGAVAVATVVPALMSQVGTLAVRQTTNTVTVPVTFSDTAGVASVDLYVSDNGGPFTLAQTLSAGGATAGSLSFTFTGADRNTYTFHSIAHDTYGDAESKSATLIEASTYVPDLNPPVTHVLASSPSYSWGAFPAGIFSGYTASSYNNGVFTLTWAGADPDQPAGGTIASVSVYVQIDGGTTALVGTITPGSPTTVTSVGTTYQVYSGSLTYSALGDGVPHTYAFYSLGTDDQRMTQAAPATADATFSNVSFGAPLSVSLSVEKGIQERSYVRYLDVNFNYTVATSSALQILQNGLAGSQPGAYVELLWYGENLTAASTSQGSVNLFGAGTTAQVSLSGSDLSIDFGAGGVTGLLTEANVSGTGSPKTTFGDGWYALGIDPYGDPSRNLVYWLPFFRLLGDVNGDGQVTGPTTTAGTDAYLVNQARGQTGSLLNADVNGDGAINSTDLQEVTAAASAHDKVGSTAPRTFPQFQLLAGRGNSAAAGGLSEAQVQAVLPEAITAWQAAGLDPAGVQVLRQVQVQIANLGTNILGLEDPGLIRLNRTAAGQGWDVAGGSISLLTVLEHELGHVVGRTDNAVPGDLLNVTLAPGVLRAPTPADVAQTAPLTNAAEVAIVGPVGAVSPDVGLLASGALLALAPASVDASSLSSDQPAESALYQGSAGGTVLVAGAGDELLIGDSGRDRLVGGFVSAPPDAGPSADAVVPGVLAGWDLEPSDAGPLWNGTSGLGTDEAVWHLARILTGADVGS
jgi:hypothetical protein